MYNKSLVFVQNLFVEQTCTLYIIKVYNVQLKCIMLVCNVNDKIYF